MSRTTLVGEIKPYAGSDEPTGWLKCDGRPISRTDYSALFNVIGTTYGSGDESTTFNLPDMRDRFPVGAGSSYSLNDKGGANTVGLATGNLPSHTHPVGRALGLSTGKWAGETYSGSLSGTGAKLGHTTGSGTISTITATSGTGSGTAHENRPPYIGINFLIFAGKSA